MCGICGVVWHRDLFDGLGRSRRITEQMLVAMAHRGPDGQGVVSSRTASLGHVRLSIIDVAEGAQPMQTETGDVAISYNGELYDFRARREVLARGGWNFRTQSDTEVLLAQYALSPDSVDHDLNGMYAFAVLEQRAKSDEVHLFVDPVGIKPLFLFSNDEVSIFASELRAVLAGMRSAGYSPSVDEYAALQFLKFGWVPGPTTLVQGVQKLQPGARWTLFGDSRGAKEHNPRPLPQRSCQISNSAELDSRLHAAVLAAIDRQTVADVPLGFFLSGGVDSSLLVGAAVEQGIDARTYTARFTGSGHGVSAANEADVAQTVAKHYGTRHSECVIDAGVLVDHLDQAFWAMDQPLADAACLPLLLLSRFAREEVKVCISGDGGDELFAGYLRHRLAPWQVFWSKLPRPIRGLSRSLVSTFPSSPGSGYHELFRRARVGMELLDSPLYVSGPFAGRCSDYISSSEVGELPEWARITDLTARSMMRADFSGQLYGQMLPKTDHITMAASLECRVPLLDLEIVELASAVPLKMKRTLFSQGKLPLRRLLRKFLPAEIADRPKHGFRVPLTSWFRNELADECQARLLCSGQVFGQLISSASVEALLARHINGAAECSIQIWSMLALHSWLTTNQLKLN